MEQLRLISLNLIKQQQKYKNDTLEILFLIKEVYIDQEHTYAFTFLKGYGFSCTRKYCIIGARMCVIEYDNLHINLIN